MKTAWVQVTIPKGWGWGKLSLGPSEQVKKAGGLIIFIIPLAASTPSGLHLCLEQSHVLEGKPVPSGH